MTKKLMHVLEGALGMGPGQLFILQMWNLSRVHRVVSIAVRTGFQGTLLKERMNLFGHGKQTEASTGSKPQACSIAKASPPSSTGWS
jgi:hypothetical protein